MIFQEWTANLLDIKKPEREGKQVDGADEFFDKIKCEEL